MVHLDELEGQVRLELIHDEPGAAVAGIDHDFQALELSHIDVRQQMRRCTPAWCRCCAERRGARLLETAQRSAKPRISRRPLSPLIGFDCSAHELHAVVVRRIVAGRDHDAAVVAAVEGREIHPLGAADADVVDVDAAVGQAAAQRVGEPRAREPDVAPDHHALGREELGIAPPDAIRNIIIQFGGNPAAQIIGLEARDRTQVLVPWRP